MAKCYYLKHKQSGLYFSLFGDVEKILHALTFYSTNDKLLMEIIERSPEYSIEEEELK